jgi:hypothetical protein
LRTTKTSTGTIRHCKSGCRCCCCCQPDRSRVVVVVVGGGIPRVLVADVVRRRQNRRYAITTTRRRQWQPKNHDHHHNDDCQECQHQLLRPAGHYRHHQHSCFAHAPFPIIYFCAAPGSTRSRSPLWTARAASIAPGAAFWSGYWVQRHTEVAASKACSGIVVMDQELESAMNGPLEWSRVAQCPETRQWAPSRETIIGLG